VTSSPQRILDRERTIAAPVDYEGILKMESASGLPLATTAADGSTAADKKAATGELVYSRAVEKP
jgi:hypothetical protein